MASEIKKMNIKEFQKKGFLQEANRMFFHPLGLALEIIVDWPKNVTDEEKKEYKTPDKHPKSGYKMGGVWDYRDDPEGMLFGDGMIDKKKSSNIEELRVSKLAKRVKLMNCNEHGIQQE